MEQDALWLRVEEDVEKKRHVKDPFREPYVELVSASFDRFIRLPLHNTEELQTEEQSCSSVQNEDDPVTLRQEISARSQQVHLRLEILRHQVHNLYEESTALVQQTDRQCEQIKRCKKVDRVNTDPSAPKTLHEPVVDIEKLLTKLTVYESNQMNDIDIQKSWNLSCDCESHQVQGVNEMMRSIEKAVHEEYRLHLENEQLAIGPIIRYDAGGELCSMETRDNLHEYMKTIKPFFLEDFINVQVDDSQEAQSSSDIDIDDLPNNVTDADDNNKPVEIGDPYANGIAYPEYENRLSQFKGREIMVEASGKISASLAVEQVDLVVPNRENSGAPIPHFSCSTTKQKRDKMQRLFLNGEAVFHKSHPSKPNVCNISRHQKGKDSTQSGLVEFKYFSDFSKSLLNCNVDLLGLRDELSERYQSDISHGMEGDLNGSILMTNADISQSDSFEDQTVSSSTVSLATNHDFSDGNVNSMTRQIPKRVRVNDEIPSPKRSKTALRNKRKSTLRAMLASIKTIFNRIARMSRVSYLSSIINNLDMECPPQRIFVGVVFAASLINIEAESIQNSQIREVVLEDNMDHTNVKVVVHPPTLH